jgi:formate C-acetyltransferase
MYICEKDRSFIENKYHDTTKPFDPHQKFTYHGTVSEYSDGLDDKEMREAMDRFYEEGKGKDRALVKAMAFAFVLDNAKIHVSDKDYFPCIYNWGRPLDAPLIIKWIDELFEGIEGLNEQICSYRDSGVADMWLDTCHVVPDWQDILALGFSGMLERVRGYHGKFKGENDLTPKEEAFFSSIEIEYEAILRLIDRIAEYARAHESEKSPLIVSALEAIRHRAPENTFEALMLMYVYFMCSESIDSYQVRSMGNGFDRALYKYYANDVESGRFTRAEIKSFIAYFFMQFSAIGNYWGQPLYLCSTDYDCKTDISTLTLDILDVFDSLDIYNPKIQIKVDEKTPKAVLAKALDIVRRGKSSFVFCCVPGMIKALMGCYGVTYEEARDCDISGCNEMHVRADEANMISGILNISKAVSYVFDNGYDEISGKQIGLKTGDVTKFESFEEFYSAVIAQLTHLIDQAIGMARKYEHHVADVNPAIMLSATMKRALEKKVDAYAFGIKYPTSSILYNAYATTVDSILAVKELVFDKKEATISDFKNALDRNWQGYEWLREKALRADRKYGINDEMADAYASALHRWISIYITGQKNSRGSVYKTGAPSTLHFISQGKSTKATPDGRRMGEELSKNSAPVIGMERRGVTAVINSAIKTVPSLNSEAYVLDVMLHPSAVKGDDGLDAMCALVTSYMKRDGVSIQFNVFNAEMLRDAQQNPEKYKNLQVRISGWSILWNDLSKEEQDSYIIRAEGLGNG